MLQAVKLKEIAVKAKGGNKPVARKQMSRKPLAGRSVFRPCPTQGDEA
jgi:hypothetical protein